ncbi:MAG: DUF3499 family protein [Acidimicrobiia bacterium]|nr:DUF3499 family protein [Acidimicrobiia bacterium]
MNPTAPDVNGVCGKQSCVRPARVALTFDYRDRCVWLDDLDADADPRATLLCAPCGTRFTVPLGWQLVDRTSAEVDTVVAPPAPSAPPQRRSPAHPAVAVRGDHGPDDVDSSLDLQMPDEEHPSGPLDLRDRREPKAVTLELERLARHLDTIPTPGSDMSRPGIPVRRAAPQPADVARALDDDDEDTFGDAVEDLTEELSVVGLVDPWPDDDTQIEPPR